MSGGSDPTDVNDYPDADGDGVPDYVEARQSTDPNNAADVLDTDTDGLSDYDEGQRGTSPTNTDTDGDEILDGDQVTDGSNPNDAGSYLDSDGDGVPNQVEVSDGTDPNDGSSFLDTDSDGVANYTIAHGGAPRPVHCTFTFSGQYAANASNKGIARLYLTYFRRQPDSAGFAYWSGLAANGLATSEIARYFAESAEFQNKYRNETDQAFTTAIYENFPCRQPDSAGASHWNTNLGDSSLSRLDMIAEILASDEFVSLTSSG